MKLIKLALVTLSISFALLSRAEDGSRLWLRADADAQAQVSANKKGESIAIAVQELQTQWKGAPVQLNMVGKTRLPNPDAFTITGDSRNGVNISASSEKGLLYGAYHLLRMQETGQLNGELNIAESPSYNLRILNHWDNLDGSIERGYAGQSLWRWEQLPETVSPRYREYARANASIGINGTVLNNVNASPQILKTEMLEKVKVLAGIFRPYGIKVYLSVNFSSPVILDGLKTADPLDKTVQQWWKNKAAEIYRLIPDFGGFLVKANSEGQPGPQDFGRTHAEGANTLADALKPYGGIVMWRAFVYNPSGDDRAKQAYLEFTPLDGQFRDNVIVQVKNGPIDFQPREPFNALFGAMKKTPLMPELQVTQEYLGFSNHLVFLASMWKEFLNSDTYCKGEGSTVAKVTDGTVFPNKLTAIAGVANTGDNTNWCGHHFAQANWYAFGRLAWKHQLTPAEIADEWLRLTFSSDIALVNPVKEMMLSSWETTVSYMMPLGLHHIFAWSHHYGPEPWCAIPGARPDWLPSYYHQADNTGLGFNRTTTGSNAVSQYESPLREILNNPNTCPENLLVWFHHIPWNHTMKNGRSFWEELCYRYDAGVQQVRAFQKIWDRQENRVDAERFCHVQSRLKIQSKDAVWWKDACLLYFQTFSKRPVPYDIERPVNELEELKMIKLHLK
ncbi:MAG: alpha-glucuronidase [Dysgonamonadaceae bacterium]|jgi:alpha-glucuronidase|nr:alpha-glucuronidase [Dysgonamonadaceae bacterium]